MGAAKIRPRRSPLRESGQRRRCDKMIRLFGARQQSILASRESRRRHGPPSVDVVDQGVVPTCVPTALNGKPHDQWHAGVYDNSGRICASSLIERSRPERKMSVPFLPIDINLDAIEHIQGQAVYGGLLFNNFGHFLLESTNRLWWPLRERFSDYIVFQNTDPLNVTGEFAKRFFDLIGISERIIITTSAVSFDRVIVPEPSFVIQRHFYKEFRLPFLIAGESAKKFTSSMPKSMLTDAPGLYLSRRRYGFRRSFGEEHIENRLSEEGFAIISMETLPLEHQILMVQKHKSIIGVMGSAFHTMPFSTVSKNATYICRDFDINVNYFMIDELMQNDSIYIFGDRMSSESRTRYYSDDITLNLPSIFKFLADAGILRGSSRDME